MNKEKILSKFNINMKDYNLELEEILDKKKFDIEAQNLLLSMFYKIENFYTDYKQVKRQVPLKDEFIQNLMQNISKYCNKIEIIKPKSSKLKDKYLIDLQDRIIKTIPNEITLIYSLYKISEEKTENENDLFESAIIDALNEGYCLDASGVIRDFNGWSWTNTLEDTKLLPYNLLYQDLLLLLDLKNISKLRKVNNKKQITNKLQDILKQNYSKELAEDFFKKFIKICILLKCNKEEEYKEKLLRDYKNIKDKQDLIKNKTEFLTKVTKDKKELTKKIKEIDKILNNVDLLKQEYINRNKNVSEDKQIFSVSNFVEILEKERTDIIQKIKEYNRLIDPREFIDMKRQIEEKNKLYNIIELLEDKKESIMQNILDLQKSFLNCLEEKINKCTLKKDIINLIYEYRYYRFINYKKDKIIKDDKRLKEQDKKIISIMIKKAEKLKAIDKVCDNSEYNELIISKLFDIKAITLENIHINVIFENKNINIKYYDGSVFESEQNIECNIEDIKIKKKSRLII